MAFLVLMAAREVQYLYESNYIYLAQKQSNKQVSEHLEPVLEEDQRVRTKTHFGETKEAINAPQYHISTRESPRTHYTNPVPPHPHRSARHHHPTIVLH